MSASGVLKYQAKSSGMHKCGVKRRVSAGPLISNIREIFDASQDKELVVPVTQAKVVIADYHALLHDFLPVFHADSLRERYAGSYCVEYLGGSDSVTAPSMAGWWITLHSFSRSRLPTIPSIA